MGWSFLHISVYVLGVSGKAQGVSEAYPLLMFGSQLAKMQKGILFREIPFNALNKCKKASIAAEKVKTELKIQKLMPFCIDFA